MEKINQQTLCFLELFNNYAYKDIYEMFELALYRSVTRCDFFKTLKKDEQLIADFISDNYVVEDEEDKNNFLFAYKKAMIFESKTRYPDFEIDFSRMLDLVKGDCFNAFDGLEDDEEAVELLKEVFYGNDEIYADKEKVVNAIVKTLQELEGVSNVKIIDKTKEIKYTLNGKTFQVIIPTPED